MTEELKESILEHLEIMHRKIGETVKIKDWISTGGRQYDRHQTRYGLYQIHIQSFRVRYSGAMATIEGEHQQIEYRTDAIKYINQVNDTIILEINMKGLIWRKLEISRIDL